MVCGPGEAARKAGSEQWERRDIPTVVPRTRRGDALHAKGVGALDDDGVTLGQRSQLPRSQLVRIAGTAARRCAQLSSTTNSWKSQPGCLQTTLGWSWPPSLMECPLSVSRCPRGHVTSALKMCSVEG